MSAQGVDERMRNVHYYYYYYLCIDTVTHFYFYFFLIHRRALFSLDQSEARFAELGEYSQNMLSEAFWTPNIASSLVE